MGVGDPKSKDRGKRYWLLVFVALLATLDGSNADSVKLTRRVKRDHNIFHRFGQGIAARYGSKPPPPPPPSKDPPELKIVYTRPVKTKKIIVISSVKSASNVPGGVASIATIAPEPIQTTTPEPVPTTTVDPYPVPEDYKEADIWENEIATGNAKPGTPVLLKKSENVTMDPEKEYYFTMVKKDKSGRPSEILQLFAKNGNYKKLSSQQVADKKPIILNSYVGTQQLIYNHYKPVGKQWDVFVPVTTVSPDEYYDDTEAPTTPQGPGYVFKGRKIRPRKEITTTPSGPTEPGFIYKGRKKKMHVDEMTEAPTTTTEAPPPPPPKKKAKFDYDIPDGYEPPTMPPIKKRRKKKKKSED